MAKQSQETIQKQDLTSVLAPVSHDVIEILGKEEVARVEILAKLVSGLLELSKLPDPFKEPKNKTERLISSEVRARMEEINSVRMEAEDGGNPQLSLIARRSAPILEGAIISHRNHLAGNYNSNRKETIELEDRVLTLDPKDANGIAIEVPRLYEALEAVAADLVVPEVAEDLKALLESERKAVMLDAKTVGLQRKPHLKELLTKTWAETIDAGVRKNQALWDQKIEEHITLSTEAEDRCRRSWRVRRAHRSLIDIYSDEEFADQVLEKIKSLHNCGSALHKLMSVKSLAAAYDPSFDLLYAVIVLRKKFYKDYLGSQEFQDILADEDTKVAALAVETYITDRAKQAETLIRQAGVKLSREGRRTMHEIKETRVKRIAKRLADTAIKAEGNPYENIEADANFRQLCRNARDIMVGGGRVAHPDARRLAEELHKLHLGKTTNDGDIKLEPAESGLVVGIVTGKINSLLAVVVRLEAASTEVDVQVEKLHFDLPNQWRVLSNFNLNIALDKLKTIIGDNKGRQALMSVMPDSATARLVETTIESLWLKRTQGEDYQAEPEQIPAEYQEDPKEQEDVHKSSEEELELIDAEIMEIAEQLEWVVFPAGTTIRDTQRTLGENQVDLTRVNWERIQHLLYLADNFEGKIYRSSEAKLGTSVPYLVAEIDVCGRRFAVAECPEIGNATYVVDDMVAAGTWEELMRLSKADARSLGARRIIHPKEEGHLFKIVRCINSMLTIKVS